MRLIEKISKVKLGEVALIKVEQIAARSGINEERLLELYVKTKNLAYRGLFSKVPFSERILLLPQCLRRKGCSAKLGPFGYECEWCGECEVGKLVEMAKKLGYKGAYVLSGGSVVQKIFERLRPKACVAVACLKELILGGFTAEKFGVVTQCVPLLKDGCVDTKVDWSEVTKALKLSGKNLRA
ncbi:TPA: DUF116 domain-containing protein [Candidatus Bathyarchaeota archaeon]|nr:DUF116 domain-containing protein [Candidatus Bathyarchaeota archaeon]